MKAHKDPPLSPMTTRGTTDPRKRMQVLENVVEASKHGVVTGLVPTPSARKNNKKWKKTKVDPEDSSYSGTETESISSTPSEYGM